MIRVKGDPIQRAPVTKALRKAVTKSVTKVPNIVTPSGKTGRPAIHATAADRQKAYRARTKNAG